MKKVFIQERYAVLHKYYTIDTLEGLHKECGCLVEVVEVCLKLVNSHNLFIFDIEAPMYKLMIEEFSLNNEQFIHVYKAVSMDEIKLIRREKLTLLGFWKLYR